MGGVVGDRAKNAGRYSSGKTEVEKGEDWQDMAREEAAEVAGVEVGIGVPISLSFSFSI